MPSAARASGLPPKCAVSLPTQRGGWKTNEAGGTTSPTLVSSPPPTPPMYPHARVTPCFWATRTLVVTHPPKEPHTRARSGASRRVGPQTRATQAPHSPFCRGAIGAATRERVTHSCRAGFGPDTVRRTRCHSRVGVLRWGVPLLSSVWPKSTVPLGVGILR
jgi:hypothetical protein